MPLDWSKLVKKFDKGDYFGKIVGFPEQCRVGWKLGKKLRIKKPKGIEKIFVTGMGGSGYSGELLQKLFFAESKIPVFVEHGYVLPKLVDKKTFCVVISYSGNTEETLGVFSQLKRKGIPTVGITSNGKLKRQCKNCVVVPGGMQPRQATGYLFFSMLAVLRKLGLSHLDEKDAKTVAKLLENEQKAVIANSRALAKALHKKMPVIYASESMQACALRWQTEINEIGKSFCHWNCIPEMQHNEINAEKGLGKAHFLLMYSGKESAKMKARMQFMKKRIKSIGYGLTEIEARGTSSLARQWYINYLGSFTSFHLAMLYGINPTPVKLIEGMKAYLKKNV